MSFSPEEALDVQSNLPEGAYLEAAVVVVQYSMPGEDDDDKRGPFLQAWRDTSHGTWNHLGMVESVAGDLRAALLRSGIDGDDDDE